jgi:hypothetical protein
MAVFSFAGQLTAQPRRDNQKWRVGAEAPQCAQLDGRHDVILG